MKVFQTVRSSSTKRWIGYAAVATLGAFVSAAEAQHLTLPASAQAATQSSEPILSTVATGEAFLASRAPAVPTPWSSTVLPAATGESSSLDATPGATDELPDAPSSTLAAASVPMHAWILDAPPTADARPMERRYTKYIRPGYRGQPLNTREKVFLGLRDAYSLKDAGATLISATYSHLINSQPNYGTDKGAYGARIGAAALREITEGIFTDSVFSIFTHEDPRYYREGPRYGNVHRTLYAITRPLVTRTDDGNSSVNGALIMGYAASAAVAMTYYPQPNRNVRDAASIFGTSIGGAALGFWVAEFSDDLLIAAHLKAKP